MRDANGQVPREPVTLRAEIRVNGTIADFGSLSARTLVTDSDGTRDAGVHGPAVAERSLRR